MCFSLANIVKFIQYKSKGVKNIEVVFTDGVRFLLLFDYFVYYVVVFLLYFLFEINSYKFQDTELTKN